MTETALIHVVDDDDSVRLSLDSLFRSVGLDTRLHASPRDFLDAPRSVGPACLVLDVRLPGMSGLDVQSRLVGTDVRMPVILMTGYGDIPMTVRAMKAGAVDFLTKPFRDQDMLDAVSAAIEMDRARLVAEEGAAELRALFETLSPRERQVMALVTAGRMNKQIAGALSLSEVTVKIHRGAAMRKMGARSLAHLVRMAESLHLSVDDP